MRHYYAIEHRYGANVCDRDGDHIGALHAFASRADRAAWVAQGNDYQDQPGARDALSTRRPADKRAIRRTVSETPRRVSYKVVTEEVQLAEEPPA